MEKDVILSIRNVTKKFPGVIALDDVSLNVKKGEVHGLIGENGAGKSTLMKIMSGVFKRDAGEIFFNGDSIGDITPEQSQELGISIIYQEFNLISKLSIAENIYLNRLNDKKKIVDWKALHLKAKEMLKSIGYDLDVKQTVGSLSVAQKQMVEIAKALSYNSQLIIMDEPTATLTSKELDTFFGVIAGLRKKGITVIFISHKLDEVYKLCDTVTVLRDGKIIGTSPIDKIAKEEIIHMMVGRVMEQEFPERIPNIREEILRVENISDKKKVKGINFNLHKGEILGIVGLVGAGRTELIRAIFGASKKTSGKIYINGEEVDLKSPRESMKAKMALLTEDRKNQGLFLNYPINRNVCVTNIKKIIKKVFISNKLQNKYAKDFIKKLSIKTPSEYQTAKNLSGGNQQKLVLAKWMYTDPDIFIMDEPTRGIDVGSKYEIYQLMNMLVAEGKSIIFISSELHEVLSMSDRVIVLYEGTLRGEFGREEMCSETVIKCAIGQ